MPDYNAVRFDPPAPVAQCTVRNPRTGEAVTEVILLLDTGADITLVPRLVAEQLGAEPMSDRAYELVGFDGSITKAFPVHLEITLLGRAYSGRFLLVDDEWGILGRNILNTLAVSLDGLRLWWDLADATRTVSAQVD